MADQQLRVALIGCDDHGRSGHLTAYRQLIDRGEAVDLVAVCDQSAARARAAAEAFGVPRWFTDHRKLLAEIRPDAVSIATPPLAHLEQTLAALAAGAHVLCEKPLAMNAVEAEQMVTAARRAGRVLTMGLQNRYNPAA